MDYKTLPGADAALIESTVVYSYIAPTTPQTGRPAGIPVRIDLFNAAAVTRTATIAMTGAASFDVALTAKAKASIEILQTAQITVTADDADVYVWKTNI